MIPIRMCDAVQIKDLIESEALKVNPSKGYIAANTKSEKILEELSSNSDNIVRSNVAWNLNCSAKTLEKLSNDSDFNVRYWVVCNRNCSAKTLEKLSNDSYWNVRYNVARNPNCPIEILEKLSKDMDYFVQSYANQRLNQIRSA